MTDVMAHSKGCAFLCPKLFSAAEIPQGLLSAVFLRPFSVSSNIYKIYDLKDRTDFGGIKVEDK